MCFPNGHSLILHCSLIVFDIIFVVFYKSESVLLSMIFIGMMQQFIHRHEKEEEKQNCLKTVDVARQAMRAGGTAKSELKEALEKTTALKEKYIYHIDIKFHF